ncbi:DUF421 domain-containing protein [Desertivirga arenae]|uniref:DUF421 domain-containing protein n=1 Tax=Desertivirga arenae TaxID=2810309 RepID=UPI001A957BBE|nr:YetF domain-containing protein [Pedobacter sp. SYSU D00823]
MTSIKVFDWHRIFIGDLPTLFLLEIIFRTSIMYGYTIFLLRFLGKRGMGQLSSLEVAIIICFGTAIGDPMMGVNVPIIHGLIAVTTIALLQVGMERFINRNKKVEEFMEGTADKVVENGLILVDELHKENISHEDLFRSLRSNSVKHLGQVEHAFFETSGQISVIFRPEDKVKPGLTVIPPEQLAEDKIIREREAAPASAVYCCTNCGNAKYYKQQELVVACILCSCNNWTEASI